LQIMLGCIRDTTTDTGLTVKATLLDKPFDKGIKLSKAVWNAVQIQRRPICPQWNYIIRPRLFLPSV